MIGTYHAYAGRLVADNALREGLEPSMRLITPALSWQLASGIVAAYDGPMDEIGWTPATVTAAVLKLAGDLAEHLRNPDEVTDVGKRLSLEHSRLPGRVPAAVMKILTTQRSREQLLPLVERYAAAKAAREVIDHGDQVALAARIATRHPEVGAGERARYQVVLLDEYQDTSHAQLVLLQALYGGGHPVTAVGDPCQSIYGWRGASAGNLRRFTVDFPTDSGGVPSPAPVLLLSTSFRNSGQVLDAAAAVQADLRAEAPDVPRLAPAPDRSARGEVTCALLETVSDEAEWVAGQVAALLAREPGQAPDGQAWHDNRAAGVRPSDIAVLCRKRAQFVPLRRAIEARGVPVEVVGLGGLLAVPEVQDVVATLRVLQDAGASDAVARLLTGPRWRIGPRDLVALGRRAREIVRGDTHAGSGASDGSGGSDAAEAAESAEPADAADEQDALAEAITDLTAETGSLVEALDDMGDADAYSAVGYARMQALAAELRRLRAHVGRPLADLAAEVERVLGLDIEVAARPGADPVAARADLDAFIDVAATFTGDTSEPGLGAFLAFLAAAQQEEYGLETGRVGESDSVKLLTVHAAKGLQWPAVFVPGLAMGERSQVFPARPRVSTRWTENARLIPFMLRGDAGDLPVLHGLDSFSLTAFSEACVARDLAEERRLMYVAATRAAFWLGCSGYWWGEGGTSRWDRPRSWTRCARPGPRRCRSGRTRPMPTRRTRCSRPCRRPAGGQPGGAVLRRGPRGRGPGGRRGKFRRGGFRRLGLWCIGLCCGGLRCGAGRRGAGGDGLDAADRDLVTAWNRDADLLLAERAQRRDGGTIEVALPGRLSVTSLVSLARDPDELARQVRRPMPHPPARQARRVPLFTAGSRNGTASSG